MTKKSMNRQIKNLEDRKAKKAMAHLDALAAAYIQEIGIPPSEATLIAEEVEGDGKDVRKKVKYYFQHTGPRINQEQAHPDVKILLQYSLLLVQSHKEKNQDALGQILNQLTDFLKKYEDEADADKREEKLQDSVGTEGGHLEGRTP